MPDTADPKKYFARMQYNGANYHGWQRQDNARTVQGEIENALGVLFKQQTSILGSGRTDTGVHASCQYFHFEQNLGSFSCGQLARKMNGILDRDIAIDKIIPVIPEAHARFDASSRAYRYHLHFGKNPFLEGRSYQYRGQPVDMDAMNEASKLLVGKHDFECYSKVHTDVNNFICEISEAGFTGNDEKMAFYIKANRFLRGMVRAVVGTLLLVGQGKMSKKEFENVIISKSRGQAGANVPPHGLYLCEVNYPETIFLNGGA